MIETRSLKAEASSPPKPVKLPEKAQKLWDFRVYRAYYRASYRVERRPQGQAPKPEALKLR